MKLIVGLGNPGQKYELTRHNIGFMALDQFAQNQRVDFKIDNKLKALVAEISIGSNKAMLVKPITFMNLSGESVVKAINYYNIELADVIIVVDDINLDIGMVRLRELGGHGGHNGLRSIINHLKTRAFKRIRLGVGLDERVPLDSFVLGKFNKNEMNQVDKALDVSICALIDFIEMVPYIDVMTKFNTQSK